MCLFNLFQDIFLLSRGQRLESIPIKRTPLSINGRTFVLKFTPAAFPHTAMQPLFLIEGIKLPNTSPPTVSITAAHSPFLRSLLSLSKSSYPSFDDTIQLYPTPETSITIEFSDKELIFPLKKVIINR